MKVFIYGGSGRVGEPVLKQISAKGHKAVTIAENENRAEELKKLGAIKVIISKGESFTKAIDGCEAIICIADSSVAAGEDQDILVDHGAVTKLLEAAQRQNTNRIVYLSPVRLDESKKSEETGAKDEPEEWIKKANLIYTVIRTAKQVAKPGKGMIKIAEVISEEKVDIPYEDVAAVLVEALDHPHTFNKAFEVMAGDSTITDALNSLGNVNLG